jgi:hypothetical protein
MSRKSGTRIEKFIKFLHSKIPSKIIIFTENLKTLKESDLVDDSERSLMSVFRDWLLEIFQYGFFLTCVWNTFVSQESIGMNIWLVFVLGLSRWLLFDTVGNIKTKIRD